MQLSFITIITYYVYFYKGMKTCCHNKVHAVMYTKHSSPYVHVYIYSRINKFSKAM